MFLKNKNIIFEIRRSKVTDYAALTNREDPDEMPHHAAFHMAGSSLSSKVPVQGFPVCKGLNGVSSY